MIYQTIPIQVEGSLPDSRLITYLQEHSDSMAVNKRPLILICPGGGYGYTSDREAEPVALAFLAMGYHAAVLRYSCAPAAYPTALLELAAAMKLIREHAEEWYVDADRIIVEGGSAGGHLAACLGMFWQEAFLADRLGIAHDRQSILKPNGMILCYPVVTSGEFAHKGSFRNLIGERSPEETEELMEKLSLEKQVTTNTPPAFIWGTFADMSVPMENSLLLVSAFRKAGIPVEYHLYPRGGHGLALANWQTETSDHRHVQEEVSTWTGLAKTWLEKLFEMS